MLIHSMYSFHDHDPASSHFLERLVNNAVFLKRHVSTSCETVREYGTTDQILIFRG